MYTDQRVAAFVEEHFIPVRVHVKEQPDQFSRLGGRYGAQWTPTILLIDEQGNERHRIEGFLPADDFLSQLELGAAKVAFASGQFDAAARQFEQVVEKYLESDAAPEAMYWAGVARYKATKDPSHLSATTKRFRERYQNSSWAKKASVWG